MKKTIILFVMTLVLILGITLVGKVYTDTIVPVNVLCVSKGEAKDYVNCSGIIERKNEESVYCDENILINKVCITEGQTVRKGDLLFTATNSSGSIINYYAPSDGKIYALNIEEGETVASSKKAISLCDNDSLIVRMQVSEGSIRSVKTGQNATITGVGFQGEFYGTVTEIGEEAIRLSQSATVVEVLVEVQTTTDQMKPGLTASVKIVTVDEDSVILVPYDSICSDGEAEYVFVDQNGYAQKKEISTGREFENGAEILTGLSAGDAVICDPKNINSGTAVVRKEQ